MRSQSFLHDPPNQINVEGIFLLFGDFLTKLIFASVRLGPFRGHFNHEHRYSGSCDFIVTQKTADSKACRGFIGFFIIFWLCR